MAVNKEVFLITGGAGFIGSNIAGALLKSGHTVRILDNFSTGKRENIKEFQDRIEVVDGDMRSFHVVQKAIEGVDVVLHQAALPSVPRSVIDPISSNDVNVNGLLNVLYASKESKVRRVVFASSSSVYGDNPVLPKQEEMVVNPLSPYAVTKSTAEQYLKVFSNLYGLHTVALRYFNVFGPKQDPDSYYSAVIPKFIKAILDDQRPEIYGDGEQSRDFTYIDNVIRGNILAATIDCKPGLALNCACHGQITLNHLIEKINANLGKNVKPIYKEGRLGDIKHSFADIEKIKNILGFEPLVSFEEGLKKTIDWYINKKRE